MAERVMTAALAVIKIAGEPVGKIRSIRCTETFRRGDVRGIGEILSSEKPVIGWDGTLSCGFYTIDMKKLGNVASRKWGFNRQTGDLMKFVNTFILNEVGVDIFIYKKFAETIDTTTGLVTSVGDGEFAVIEKAFPENQSFDINEGSISGQDCSFTYLNPVLFDEAVV